jgi:CheY-like chemotaxis protein
LSVLVVEDNPDGAETLVGLVAALGHQARAVYDGDEAVRVAPQARPDVILLDIGLPGRDGFAVADELSRREELAHTLIVALTGYGREEDKQRAWAVGIERYLVKPVTIDSLEEVIDHAQSLRRRNGGARPPA